MHSKTSIKGRSERSIRISHFLSESVRIFENFEKRLGTHKQICERKSFQTRAKLKGVQLEVLEVYSNDKISNSNL